ncbi:transcriptional regulator ATRX-like [Venturia canescens]|uniref:transcriptional regulator ATRX-like n=1 Tax=Venturia canescens TaxID=32260 RepID=UPI001C9D61BA|nr:transcriptional regulator ATRX-like [Venturia canescens]
MKTQRKLEVTEVELAYRAKNYHELRARRQRELSCASCGNTLSNNTEEIFLHPTFQILQCRKCNERTEDYRESKISIVCQICLASSKRFYKCNNKDCCYKFCQACVKRNAPKSIAEAEAKRWKCFLCNSEPLWKLRGVGATVMNFTSKKTKKKKISRKRSSDTEDEKSNFKNISYVRSRRLSEAQQLKKRLSTFCDEESPRESLEPSRPLHKQNNERTKQEQIDQSKKLEKYYGQGNVLTVDISSDDSDEIKSRKIIVEKDSHSRKKESSHRISMSSRKLPSPITDSSSEDDNMEMSKKTLPKRKTKDESRFLKKRKKVSPDRCSNSEEEVKEKRKKTSESTSIRGKSTNLKGGSKSKILNTENAKSKKETKDKYKSRQSRRDPSSDSGDSEDGESNRGNSRRNETDKPDGKSNKFHNHRRLMKQDSIPSDSSSGREFRTSKLIPHSYVVLKRIEELEHDYTKTPDSSPQVCKDILTKDQAFALKNMVTNFFADLKKAATKVVNDIEVAQARYCMKNSLRHTDVDSLILETEDVVTKLQKCVDTRKNKMEDYYEKWCKKARLKNVLKSKRTNTEDSKPSSLGQTSKKSPKNKRGSSNESSPSTSRRKSRSPSPVAKSNDDETTNLNVVSDYNSDEIFSDDDARNASKKSNPNSSSHEKQGTPSHCLSIGKTSRNDDVSSDENSNKQSIKNVSKRLFDKSSSSVDSVSGDRQEAEDNCEVEKITNTSKAARLSTESVDLSDIDIFETTIDSGNEGKIEGKKASKTNDQASDSEDNSTPEGPSESTNSRTNRKRNSSGSSTDCQKPDERDTSESPTNQRDSPMANSGKEEEKTSPNEDDDNEDKISTRSPTVSPVQELISEEKILTSSKSDDKIENISGTERPKGPASRESTEEGGNDKNNEEPFKMKDSLQQPNRSGNVEQEPQEIPSIDHADTETKEDDENEMNNISIGSLETVIQEMNYNLEKKSSKLLSSNDENEEDETPMNMSDDNEKRTEKADSSPATLPRERDSPLPHDTEEIANENDDTEPAESGSNSPIDSTTERESRKNIPKVDKSRSNSPELKTSKKQTTGKEMHKNDSDEKNKREKSKSNSPEINISRRSSVDSNESDETSIDKGSKSYSGISRVSRSSTPSETEDIEARNKLLLSSNSEDSSGDENTFALQSSSNLENEDIPPTPPESDTNIPKNTEKDKSDNDPEKTEKQIAKSKRNKFRIENYPHLKADKRLSQKCEVRLKRLKQKVLDRYSRALEKSRDYVDSKNLKRLVALDKLDKKKTVNKNSDSEDENTYRKRLRNKKKTTKEREETLLDHLEKVKNGEHIELSNESESETSNKEDNRVDKNKPKDHSEDSLFAEADEMAKKRLLESSDSETGEPSAVEGLDNDKDGKEEKSKKTVKAAEKKEKSDKKSNEEKKNEEKADKGRWRKNKLLTLKISDSDSDDEKEKFESSQKKSAEKNKNEGSDSDDSEEEKTPKKKRVRRQVLHSDSDGEVSPLSDSESSDESDENPKKKKKHGSEDDGKKKRKRVRRGDPGSSSSDSLEEKRPKTRRKRIKAAASDSDSDVENSQSSPNKSGRKNIRKLIRDKQVADVTKQAAKDEEERLQRIAERQKLYNQMYESRLADETKVDKLVLDFDEETKEPLVSVAEELVKKLKPHQAQGIKFMWDACFESLERIKSTPGSGCILAHCMGLGKSFQVVALSHTLLQNEATGIKTIMVVCPLSTVLNWTNEFKIWLENVPDGDDIEVYELTKTKKNYERKHYLQNWQRTGGVMIIGYEMFRNLINTGKRVRKNIQDALLQCLVDPGPDLIVCDEGHLLKNEDTALSKAMRRVKTLRRIVLTGTPLQNNLIEYHCMVQFVKPNLLGTKKEFANRFENPITNGQFDNSTEYDVRLMKKRAHVLHKMLEGSVQRLDYSVLTPFLPPKQEYVIFVRLTKVQIKMYRHYLDNYARRAGGVGGSLFADFQALQRIWTHPLVMRLSQKQKDLANEKKRMDSDSEGSLRDFINDDTSGSSSGSDVQSISNSDDSSKKTKRGTRANPIKEEPGVVNLENNEEPRSDEWWAQFVEKEDYEDMRVSSKLLVLFAILKQSHAIGDKVLVFSQSLFSLTLIEEFLRMIDDATQAGNDDSENLDKHSGSWSLGLDYFRLDGQASTDNRRRWCEIFNKPTNTRARLFLISTRAGGLGINLTAANRVIIFDASWNPSHDVQSIFRIYRFGQKKPCYVYRLLAAGTMEEKIYNRQVTKLSLSCRVVDEQQIERHYTNNALAELYELDPCEDEKTLNLPKDRLLADIFLQYKQCVFNYHEHDSLLENQAGEELDEEERKQAWLEYEEEKKGKRILPPPAFTNYQDELFMQQTNLILSQQNPVMANPAMMLDYENIRQMISKDYPLFSEAQQRAMATRTVQEMYNYVERQTMANQHSRVNQMPLPNQVPPANQVPRTMLNSLLVDNLLAQQSAPIPTHPTPEMIRMYQQSLLPQNGQLNYPTNQNVIADSSGPARNPSIPQIPPLPSQSSAVPPAVTDDDIIEIPSSPEKILGTSPAPGGSRKSQEE